MLYLLWILGLAGAVAFTCVVAWVIEEWELF